MISTLKKILKSNRVEGTHHTHVSLIQPKGSFQFNRQTNEEFLNTYCDLIQTDKEAIVGVAEKPQHYLPILADIDLKIELRSAGGESDEIGILYTTKDVKKIILIYQTVLNEIIDGLKSEELTCVFLSKEPYQQVNNEKTYLKHGFHLHFPYIFMNKDSQQLHLIPRVKKAITELKLFENIGFEDSGKVVDAGYCKAPWLLYGSRKEGEQHKPYIVKYIFDFKLNKISLEDAFKNYSIYDDREHKIDITDKIEHYLPRILSIVPWSRGIKEVKSKLECEVIKKIKSDVKNDKVYNKPNPDDEKTENICRQLIRLCNNDKAEDRETWLQCAFILHNVFEGSDVGLQLWKEFAQKCPDKYDEEIHDNMWTKISNTGEITLGTLHFWAQTDNPKEYKKFISETYVKKQFSSIEATHADISKMFHFLKGEDIKIVDDSFIYMWDNTKKLWTHCFTRTLIPLISELVLDETKSIMKELYSAMKAETDKSKEQMYTVKIKALQKLESNLKNTNFLKNVITFYVSSYENKEFTTLINKDKFNLPLKNGKIIDLRTKVVRDRIKSDFFSFECPVSLIDDCSEAKTFIHSLSDDIQHTNYLQRLFGYFMSGDVSHRGFYIFWGVGCNGKSSTMNILKNILKQFYTGISEDIFIKKERNGGATPELMPLLNARLAVFSEGDEKSKLNSKRIKALTGQDEISARALYQDQITFTPQAKLIMLTNEKPEFDTSDRAIIDRINFIPFTKRFIKNKKNTDYIETLQTTYLDQFFSFFAEGAKLWFESGEMLESDISKQGMKEYKDELDTVKQFIDECCNTESQNTDISSKILYDEYSRYCQQSGQEALCTKKFAKRLALDYTLKKTKSCNVWVGLALKNE